MYLLYTVVEPDFERDVSVSSKTYQNCKLGIQNSNLKYKTTNCYRTGAKIRQFIFRTEAFLRFRRRLLLIDLLVCAFILTNHSLPY